MDRTYTELELLSRIANAFTKDNTVKGAAGISSIEDILFATSKYADEQSQEILARARLHSLCIDFDRQPLLVISRLRLFGSPKKARTKQSDAYYLLWHEEEHEGKNNGYLIQYLLPDSSTSRHYHAKQTESFYILHGALDIETSDGNTHLEAKDSRTVRPYTTHMLITAAKSAITVIYMRDVDCKDHHIVDKKTAG